MIDRENLLRCKLALYRELLNAEETIELTSVELDMGMLLVFDRQVQDHIEKGMSYGKKNKQGV